MSGRVLFSLTLMFALAACGSEDDGAPFQEVYDICSAITVVPSGDATAEELHALDNAISVWNAIGGTKMTRGESGELVLPVRFGDAAPVFFGRYDDTNGEVFVNRSLADLRRRSIVIAHELGHAFGLRHISPEVRASVMNAGNLDTAPTQEDGAAMRELAVGCD